MVIDFYVEVFCCVVGGEWVDVLDGKLFDYYLIIGDFGEYFVNF